MKSRPQQEREKPKNNTAHTAPGRIHYAGYHSSKRTVPLSRNGRGHLEPVGFDDYGNQAFEVVGDAKTLTREQIAHRVQLFAKVNALLAEPAAAIKVVAAAPKKKNGTLYAKRVTQIATLPVMEQDTSMYVFCAVAKGDADLLVEIRKIQTPTLEKAENDVLSQTDLFRA